MTDQEPPLLATREEALAASGEVYEHYKGGIYRLITRGARHSETLEVGVVYEHLWPHDHGFWFRPEGIFFSNLPDGQPRFKLIKED